MDSENDFEDLGPFLELVRLRLHYHRYRLPVGPYWTDFEACAADDIEKLADIAEEAVERLSKAEYAEENIRDDTQRAEEIRDEKLEAAEECRDKVCLEAELLRERVKTLESESTTVARLEAKVAKLKEIQVRNERETVRVQDEMRATARDVEQLSAEAELLAAEAQVRPPANPNAPRIEHTVSIRSSNRTGVTLNGVHDPQGIWIATCSMRFGSDNVLIHRGSIIVLDGSQYHGQDGVLDATNHHVQAAVRAGWMRPIEDPLDAPEAVLDATAGSAMEGMASSMRNFGDAIRRIQPVRLKRPRASKPKPKKPKEPVRRSSWERLDDDDF